MKYLYCLRFIISELTGFFEGEGLLTDLVSGGGMYVQTSYMTSGPPPDIMAMLPEEEAD